MPVAFVPWGALEWHGPHGPVGLDGLKAHGICLRAAALTGGIVLPPIWLGTGTLAAVMPAPHCVEISHDVVTEVAGQIISQLADGGWRLVVVVAGHYGDDQMAALRAAAAHINGQRGDVEVLVVADWETSGGVSPRDHAAAGETGILLALHPELMAVDRLPAHGELTTVEHGVWGADPRGSTEQDGAAMLEATVRGLAELVMSRLPSAT